MVNQQLIEWIRTYKKAGYNSQQLYDYLLGQGYSAAEINESIKYASLIDQPSPQTKNTQNNQLNYIQNFQQQEQQTNNNQNYNKYQQNTSPKPKKYKKIFIITIIVIVLILAVAGYFFVLKPLFKSSISYDQNYNLDYQIEYQNTQETQDTQNTQETNTNTQSQTPVTCADEVCFADKFSRCEKATVSISMLSDLTYYYEIIGPANGYCKVKSKYTKHPDSSWLGKEMTCDYINNLAFSESVKDMSRCSGLLYDLFNSGEEITI